MHTRASIRQHPIHPMLVVFPIGLWIFSFVCDLISMSGTANRLFWSDMAFYTMAGGVVGALLAAVPGFLDYLGLRERRVKRIATTHMVLNLSIVVLYVFNLGLRTNRPVSGNEPGVLVSAIAIVLLAISGWLGGSLVYKHGVAVERDSETDFERHDRAA
jgi:uncharacterized membrane protein